MRRPRGRCRGATLVEFHIVALFALLPLCLGTLQVAWLLAENHQLDLAAYQAARHAATRNGDLMAARSAFAAAATVLFIRGRGDASAERLVADVAAAHARALADLAAHARFRVLSPSAQAQADHAIVRDRLRVVPNDALEHRPSAPGRRSGLSLQQANVLRIEIRYCRPLQVPFVREMLLGTLRRLDADPWHRLCYAAGRVPIRTEGTSPMQSDFRVTS